MDVSELREQQIADHERKHERFCSLANESVEDTRFVLPQNDDPRTWEGFHRFAAYTQRYIYHRDTWAWLTTHQRPVVCPRCATEKQNYRKVQAWLCFPCWWDAYGHDRAHDMARALHRRQWYPLVGPFEEELKAG